MARAFARAAVTDDLAAEYPARREGLFNIGLLHTCLSGTKGIRKLCADQPRHTAHSGIRLLGPRSRA